MPELDPKVKKKVVKLLKKNKAQTDPLGAIHDEVVDHTDQHEEIGQKLDGISQQETQTNEKIDKVLETTNEVKDELVGHLSEIKDSIQTESKGHLDKTSTVLDSVLTRVQMLKGDKGDPGEKGESIIGPIGPQGLTGPIGPPGKDGHTPIKGVDFFDGKPGESIVGATGPAGKDGENPDPKEVVALLKKLPENEKLGLGDLRNSIELQAAIGKMKNYNPNGFQFNGKTYKFEELMHGGGGNGGGGTPGGNNTDVQFNDNGVFGGSDNFTFDKDTSSVDLNADNPRDAALYVSDTVTDNESYGIGAEAYLNGSASVGHLWAAWFYTNNDGLGTLTDSTGVYIYNNDDTGGGTITSSRGLFVENQTNGIHNFNIFSGDDNFQTTVGQGDYLSARNVFTLINDGVNFASPLFIAHEDDSAVASIGINSEVYANNPAMVTKSLVRAADFETYILGDGNVTTANVFTTYLEQDGAGTTTDAINIHILATSLLGGTITNNYGLKIDEQTVGTNNWAIKTGLGLNSFGDNVYIGPDTLPSAFTSDNPSGLLVATDSGANQYLYTARNDLFPPYLNFFKSRGTVDAPLDILTDDLLGESDYYYYHNGQQFGAYLGFKVTGTFVADIIGTQFYIGVQDNAAAPTTFVIDGPTQSASLSGHLGVNGSATTTSPLNISSLPTSAAGLASGDVWVDTAGGLNILKIV